MRPRLASLALLLLALCRASSGRVDSVNTVDTTSTQHVIHKRAIKTDGLTLPGDVPDGLLDKIQKTSNGHVLSILLAFAITAGWQPKFSSDKHLMAALNNGVLCAQKDTKTPGNIKTLVYGEDIGKDVELAKQSIYGIVCASPPATPSEEFKCYCTDNHTMIYCSTLKYTREKGLTGTKTKKCSDIALNDLKTAAPTLSKAFDYEEIKKQAEKAFYKALFETEDDDSIDKMAAEITDAEKFFCEAINSNVETAVKELFESEATFDLVEEAIFIIAFGEDGVKTLQESCDKDTDWKATVFGECLCKGETGFTYCLYKTMGKLFEQAGYLKCISSDNPAPKLVTEKKDAAKAEIKKMTQTVKAVKDKKGKGGGNGSGGGSGGGDKKGGGSGGGSSAASSSQLLLSLSAAATLLLLRH